MLDWYKIRLFFISFLFLLVLTPISLAVPPATEVFVGGSEGMDIKYPPYSIFPKETIELEFHIFNKSSGYPLTDNIDCFFHLYNKTSYHILILNDSTPSYTFDYSFEIGKDNFTYYGWYSYIVSCNTSNIGGFVAEPFEITVTGEEEPVQDNEDEYFLYFVFILAVMLLIISFIKNDHNLASVSGMILIILGGYIIASGFGSFTNSLSNGLGISLIGIGIYILLRSNIDFLTGD